MPMVYYMILVKFLILIYYLPDTTVAHKVATSNIRDKYKTDGSH